MVLSRESRCYPHFFFICQINILVWKHQVPVLPFLRDRELCAFLQKIAEIWEVNKEQRNECLAKLEKPILGWLAISLGRVIKYSFYFFRET